MGYVNQIDQKYYRLPTPPTTHKPPEEKLDHVRPSPEPSLNEDIKNYREIDEIPRKKIEYDISQGEKIITNLENENEEDEKKEEEKKLEKRGFHNIDEEIETVEDKENLNNTFSEEDSVREELRYKLNK